MTAARVSVSYASTDAKEVQALLSFFRTEGIEVTPIEWYYRPDGGVSSNLGQVAEESRYGVIVVTRSITENGTAVEHCSSMLRRAEARGGCLLAILLDGDSIPDSIGASDWYDLRGQSRDDLKRLTEILKSRILREEEVQRTYKSDVFVSYSRKDKVWVVNLARRLRQRNLLVWLDRWSIDPGTPWQTEMAKGIYAAKACVVCIGEGKPTRWAMQEIQRALDRQVEEPSFKVIPILLPRARFENVPEFLKNLQAVHFSSDYDPEAFRRLVYAIRGISPTGIDTLESRDAVIQSLEKKLSRLKSLRDRNLIDESVAIKHQDILVEKILQQDDPEDDES